MNTYARSVQPSIRNSENSAMTPPHHVPPADQKRHTRRYRHFPEAGPPGPAPRPAEDDAPIKAGSALTLPVGQDKAGVGDEGTAFIAEHGVEVNGIDPLLEFYNHCGEARDE